jgi:hypothetical protein
VAACLHSCTGYNPAASEQLAQPPPPLRGTLLLGAGHQQSMGVPAFFAWLARRYPDALTDLPPAAAAAASETEQQHAPEEDDVEARMLRSWWCDNLYLDMNGIIHPCCHPEGGAPQPNDEAEMFDNVAALLDALVSRLRPRRLLYLAIDGVAPRAKMNQQRARRFRAQAEAQERSEAGENRIGRPRESHAGAGDTAGPCHPVTMSRILWASHCLLRAEAYALGFRCRAAREAPRRGAARARATPPLVGSQRHHTRHTVHGAPRQVSEVHRASAQRGGALCRSHSTYGAAGRLMIACVALVVVALAWQLPEGAGGEAAGLRSGMAGADRALLGRVSVMFMRVRVEIIGWIIIRTD